MATKLFIEAIRDALAGEMARDERVFVLGEDVGVRGGVFRVTQGLYEVFGESRVLDTPLSESAIVGVAIGASAAGLRPVAEIQFADFILPAMNQIISEAAKMRYRSNNDWHCPMVIRAPFGGGVHGGLYHSQSMEALFTHIPGLKVLVPATPYDAKGLLISAIRDDDPVLFFEHKRLYRSVRAEVPDELFTVPIGQARVARDGEDVTVITYGLMLQWVLEAADRLAEEDGIETHVLDLRTLRPLDEGAILNAARRTGKVLIVHEDNKVCGIGAEVSALISERVLFDLDAPIERLAGPEVPAMPFASTLEQAYMLSVDRIAAAIGRLARF
ncbi:MAG: alpha-ketoacid dehydrogenase subunit beta [Alicyclobacillus herbarius]|uniref:alpha-ketoacid dehydrogenase subunit beta n=1 Tax=Alicyclobacillus herbarius TaxID=122960 RepID=UPI0023555FA2|nr:alpha-ketoacid dehydrogenase subunit beta [Alicyclobacillus herbarius]MCL6631242.1 alpha-ketoacid dehydrogenase subunit beta [Alicyclobacillus herbarius]